MLEVNNVTFSYSSHEEQDAPPALHEVNLSILPGETIAIIRHNGSGKSTLAKLLAAILKPTSGLVQVDGLRTDASGEDLWTIRQRVGIVFFFSSRRRHTSCSRDWSSDVCSSD